VGNLPYHITSPILFWMMDQADDVRSATVMIQKEVADRVVAAPGSKDYGILTVFCQFYAQCRRCFVVPAGAFFPRPKVDSAVVRMEFRPYPRQPKSVDTFRSVVRRSFGQRRKMLRNTIGPWIDASVNFDLTRRPEALTVDDFIDLSDAVDSKRMNA
jgi:16S rRNA (adenine1518-N6/adenine1519-N6)-dimethyltransferase